MAGYIDITGDCHPCPRTKVSPISPTAQSTAPNKVAISFRKRNIVPMNVRVVPGGYGGLNLRPEGFTHRLNVLAVRILAAYKEGAFASFHSYLLGRIHDRVVTIQRRHGLTKGGAFCYSNVASPDHLEAVKHSAQLSNICDFVPCAVDACATQEIWKRRPSISHS
jgi:hypothetical protein